ncbi:MAG: 3-deoxy-D-manno-octulosonate 8-phosphate phosphatase [Flavobacteriales bacterium]|nr:3-deoxy-D-manno-octulosonate 8-phosphate phosphatase [Flavobacteriales bacterium]
MESDYKNKLIKIKAIVLDVDGVLTNGGLIIYPDGKFLRQMNAKDGYAIKNALNKGYIIAVITGGREQNVKDRLTHLGVNEVFLNAHNKLPILKDFIKKYTLQKEEVLYMGDDIPDLEILKYVGVSCCPRDAVQEVKDVCNYISNKKGGEGCVRDVIEQTLKVTDKWDLNGKIQY